MDAGAVAGLAVGIDRAAVPHRLQRVDAGLHHVAARLAVERGDQADAAGIVLLRRVVGVRADAAALACPGGDESVGARASWQTPASAWRTLASDAGDLARRSWLPRHRSRAIDLRRGVAAVADRPDHQRGAAHDVAGGEHAGQAGHEASRWSIFSVPQRRDLQRRARRTAAGRSSGSKPSALITRSAGTVKWLPSIGSTDLAAGGVGQAEMHAHGAHAGDRVVAEERFGRGQPDELDAFLLGVLHLAHASPACWRGRGGRGISPSAAPWRTAVRTQSIAVSPPPITTTSLARRRSARRTSKSGTASPRPLRLEAMR